MNEQAIETPKPKVTVITGYYNRGHALNKTIDSIMNQSYTNFEFIVFNDKSTDDTEARLAEIEKKYNDPRLIIINHEENKGFVQGMIDAVKVSKGEYICVQGSGDVSHVDRLKYQVALLDEKKEVGFVGCYYENFVEDQNIIRVRKKIADDVDFEQLVQANVFSHGEVMFRKDVYNSVGGYRAEFVNCQDYDLWLRMAKISKLATAPEVLYTRYIRYDGVSYKPQRFLKQTRYFFLCQDIATKTAKEQETILAEVHHNGIESYMNLNSRRVQSRVIKAALRSVVWGENNAAKELAKRGITNLLVRNGMILFVNIYSSILGKPFKFIVNKKLGIN
jgi:glycosyltransferase involved in cell wall biosynthesis